MRFTPGDTIVLQRTWRWKDEDELARFVERGAFDGELARRLRAEGLDVARRAENDEAPFCDPWVDWRPDPAWKTPELPESWDRTCP